MNTSNMILYKTAQAEILELIVFGLQTKLYVVSVQILGSSPGCFFSSTPKNNTLGFEASAIAGPSSLAT